MKISIQGAIIIFLTIVVALIVTVVLLTIREHRECKQIKQEHKDLKTWFNNK